MTYRGFLTKLLMTECDDRARRRSDAIRLSITGLAWSNRVPDRVIARESAHDSRASW